MPRHGATPLATWPGLREPMARTRQRHGGADMTEHGKGKDTVATTQRHGKVTNWARHGADG